VVEQRVTVGVVEPRSPSYTDEERKTTVLGRFSNSMSLAR